MHVELGIRVPGADGTPLTTDIHRPRSLTPVPAVLMRTPYGTGSVAMLRFGRRLAAMGWAAVFQNVRGRYGSEGRFEPFRHEAADGRATLDWLGAQPWCDGRLVPFGVSYSTYTAAALCVEPPPLSILGMVSIVAMVRPWRHFYQGGAFRLHWALPWALLIDGARQRPLDFEALRSAIDAPLPSLPDRLGFPSRPWLDWIRHPDPRAGYWSSTEILDGLRREPPAALHIGGWYDFSLPSTLELYEALANLPGAPRQELILGPWEHNEIFTGLLRGLERQGRHRDSEGGVPARASGEDRLAASLAAFLCRRRDDDAKAAAAPPPVQLFRREAGVAGTWLDLETWPDAVRVRRFRLAAGDGRSDGRLSTGPSTDPPNAVRWHHDPRNPVPTIGGRAWAAPGWQTAGPADQGPVADRDDVPCFTSEPLDSDLEISGPCRLLLNTLRESDGEPPAGGAADYAARLLDVDGESTLWVADGIVRLETSAAAGEAWRAIVDLGQICYLFRSGHRLRILLSSSLFPLFDQVLRAGPRGIVVDSDDASVLELRLAGSNNTA